MQKLTRDDIKCARPAHAHFTGAKFKSMKIQLIFQIQCKFLINMLDDSISNPRWRHHSHATSPSEFIIHTLQSDKIVKRYSRFSFVGIYITYGRTLCFAAFFILRAEILPSSLRCYITATSTAICHASHHYHFHVRFFNSFQLVAILLSFYFSCKLSFNVKICS